MPVDRRRLRQLVLEVNDQAIADSPFDEWTRKTTVVRPRRHPFAGRDVHGGNLRGEVDFDDVGIRIEIFRFCQANVGIPVSGRVRGLGA